MNFNSFTKHNKESSFSFNNKMHLSDEIKNDNDVISFRRHARDFFAFINVALINSAAFIKNDSLILISFSFSADNIT